VLSSSSREALDSKATLKGLKGRISLEVGIIGDFSFGALGTGHDEVFEVVIVFFGCKGLLAFGGRFVFGRGTVRKGSFFFVFRFSRTHNADIV